MEPITGGGAFEGWNADDFPIGEVGVLSQIKPGKWIWHYCCVSAG
jgi:hypothetical protein